MGEAQRQSHWPAWKLPVLEPMPRIVALDGHPCNYLPGRESGFRAFGAGKISPEAYQDCLDAGFRRSGRLIYQPACTGCRSCVPIRVPVERFSPSKDQRRAMRRNADLQVKAGPPQWTPEKFALYLRYQEHWHNKPKGSGLREFVEFLYESPVETVEFEYRQRSTLIGVGICDVTAKCVSSVYFYFEPSLAKRSLGTFSAQFEILWAREMGIPYWYAGYWIEGCREMRYKTRYRPCELLGTDGQWREHP